MIPAPCTDQTCVDSTSLPCCLGRVVILLPHTLVSSGSEGAELDVEVEASKAARDKYTVQFPSQWCTVWNSKWRVHKTERELI